MLGAKQLQSCSTLYDPMDCSQPSSSVHGIFQASILEWVATTSSRASSWLRDLTWISCVSCFLNWPAGSLPLAPPGKPLSFHVCVKSLSRVQLCDPMDCSPPGSSVHGILQARILESVAISFSRGSSQPRDWTRVSRIAGRRFILWATRDLNLIIFPRIAMLPLGNSKN